MFVSSGSAGGGPVPQGSKEVPEPPKPPEFGRELELKWVQVIGVGMLVLIVLLALFGLFGHSSSRSAGEGELLALEVTHPDRFRYKTLDSLDVQVANLSSEPIPTVTVRFDRDYIDSFSSVQFTPSPESITSEAYEVALRDIAPGMEKRVAVTVQAEKYWRRRGYVEAEAGAERVLVDLSTFVFP